MRDQPVFVRSRWSSAFPSWSMEGHSKWMNRDDAATVKFMFVSLNVGELVLTMMRLPTRVCSIVLSIRICEPPLGIAIQNWVRKLVSTESTDMRVKSVGHNDA